ncbi:hypothetical protein SG34_007935 [Thalassomonas viridans]|uniref:SH3 domain-containing protein n=1 Tax=Thalassomonas viridans TaxID=137584 RepID=A0AAE9Z7P0_9GAMM|nr:SH3 domain-containing protein [Thalassomonas viridans]WDE06818.1 hypothetical protein SG34_007935 [Thalassomonas viridans]
MQVVVIEAHVSNYPEPIHFGQGDMLALGELDTEFPGWIRVTTADRNQGWAPVQYINFEPGAAQGTAKCSYNARELNTELNEVLTVVRELNGWYLARNGEGQLGWVPVRSVQAVESIA